ncbi:Estrogen sulfotransferase [Holothuria leucospilota]|uniref:Estrogen sulfotransferase n=1 Tax=Holothuria leucospilota TaxID=206669 RepID=A0A9Q1BSV4_HOLLE|nr:Estrogen sulfotransferase [Holothuria leucospilota]
MPNNSVDKAVDAVENFEYRKDDVWLIGYNKSGTHWMNEVMQLIFTEGDPSKLDHRHRRDILEITEVTDLCMVDKMEPTVEFVKTDPSPRVLKTHLRPEHLPKETWVKKIPIVYILRNPKDVFISLFNFLSKFTDKNGDPCLKPEDFDKFLQDFISGEVPYDGWYDHVTSYEALIGKVDHVLFVTYEDMKKDLPAVIKIVAKHIGCNVTDEVVDKIVENTTVEAMKRNK